MDLKVEGCTIQVRTFAPSMAMDRMADGVLDSKNSMPDRYGRRLVQGYPMDECSLRHAWSTGSSKA